MTARQVLCSHLEQIHTTRMGEERIRKNLHLQQEDAVAYCKACILDPSAEIVDRGKNDYCTCSHTVITIHSHSFTIITAHRQK
jgi:hypothetical protein